MKTSSNKYNNELGLDKIILFIWFQRALIIYTTLISILIFLSYYFISNNFQFDKKKSFNYSLLIKPAQNNDLKAIRYFIELLDIDDYINYKSETLNEMILKKFADKINKKDEFKKVLENKNLNNENLSSFNAYSKLLTISAASEKDVKILNYPIYKINLIWDSDDAIDIIDQTLKLTLTNLQKIIFQEFRDYLDIKRKKILTDDLTKLDYLKEQSKIAKILNIEKASNPFVQLQNTSAEYLKGYLALEQEIKLIENRKYNHLSVIESEINSYEKLKMSLIEYEIANLEKVQPNKSYGFYTLLILTIITGFLLGIFISYLRNLIQSAKFEKRNKL